MPVQQKIFESIAGKGEIILNNQFLLLPQCFQFQLIIRMSGFYILFTNVFRTDKFEYRMRLSIKEIIFFQQSMYADDDDDDDEDDDDDDEYEDEEDEVQNYSRPVRR